jgi:mono/diheme cytochrome c family protein
LLVACLASACRQDMHDQPRGEAYEGARFFADGRMMRPLVPGTVARGRLDEDEHLHRGLQNGELAREFPFAIDLAALQRGRDRYAIHCTPCHDASGSGDGMIVRRGMKRPPSFHEQRLREAPPGHYFDVMTRGFGAMFDQADRISAEDRWKIAAYVRVLQRSQNASVEDVPADRRAQLEVQAVPGAQEHAR